MGDQKEEWFWSNKDTSHCSINAFINDSVESRTSEGSLSIIDETTETHSDISTINP